jgi:phosphate transport system permease protein
MTTLDVAPAQPWRRSSAARLHNVGYGLIAGGGAGVLTLMGPLAGPFGYFLAFVVIRMALSVPLLLKDRVAAKDEIMAVLITAGFVTAFIPWVSIITTVVRQGARALHAGYLFTDMSTTAASGPLTEGGLIHALVGTAIILVLAAVIAIPLGIVTAVYVTEIRGRLTPFVRLMTLSMSGIPSIVAGLFVYSTVVAWIGFSTIAGAVALSILMLPTVSRTAEEVLGLVPLEIRQASYALGSNQVGTTFKVVLPTVRSGLVTASVLGLARVAGETAPLIFTAFYSAAFSISLTGGPIGSLPMYVYQNFRVGTDEAITRAWGGATVLLVFIATLFILARVLAGRSRKQV